MDFTFSPAQEEFAEKAKEACARYLVGSVGAREKAKDIGHDVIKNLASYGLLGVAVPKEFGGAGLGPLAYVLGLREVAAVDASVAVTVAVTNLVAEVICRFGSHAQKREIVPKLVSGEYFAGSFGLSEAGAGSDAGSLTTEAIRKDGSWVLNGQKMWISAADKAGVIVVWARTGGAGAKGITAFLLEAPCHGLRAGPPEEKMGLLASHTVALNLDDVVVADHAQLGNLGEGFKIAMMALDGGRIGIGAQAQGMGRCALHLARRYAQKREQFGRTIAQFQATQFKLADMAVELDTAWLLTLRAAWLKESKKAFSYEAAMAKLMASEAANRVVREAVQICGGFGYMEDTGEDMTVARLYRDCRVTQIYEGTSEIQRVVIARELLRTNEVGLG